MEPKLDGIDVSNNNRVDYWNLVPGDLAVVRATQGGWYSDSDYLWNVARARSVKRYVGHYMVAENTVDVVSNQLQTSEVQVDKFLQVVGKPHPGDFAVVDWESPRKNVTPPPIRDIIAIIRGLEKCGWRGRVMWYTFYSLAHHALSAFEGRPLWLSTLGNPYMLGYRWCQELGATLWQYDQHEVEGCRTIPIDVNMILDVATMDRLCGLEEEAPPEPEEDEAVYFQMISDMGNVYLFGPQGAVYMGGLGTAHGKLNESKTAPVAAFDVPDAELAQFADRWREGMRG